MIVTAVTNTNIATCEATSTDITDYKDIYYKDYEKMEGQKQQILEHR